MQNWPIIWATHYASCPAPTTTLTSFNPQNLSKHLLGWKSLDAADGHLIWTLLSGFEQKPGRLVLDPQTEIVARFGGVWPFVSCRSRMKRNLSHSKPKIWINPLYWCQLSIIQRPGTNGSFSRKYQIIQLRGNDFALLSQYFLLEKVWSLGKICVCWQFCPESDGLGGLFLEVWLYVGQIER